MDQPTTPTETNAQPTTDPVAEPVPEFGVEKKTSIVSSLPLKKMAIGFGIVALIAVIGIVGKLIYSQVVNPSTTTTTTQKQITLNYWGLWEPTEVLQSTIKEFESQNPGVTVVYSQQSVKDYRERLQSAFDRGQGPDIFRFHNTWVPMFTKTGVLSTVPTDIMTSAEFEKTFYPVAATDLKTQSGYVGIPLEIDGLGLYINKKIFDTANKTAPTTWDDLRKVAQQLTIRGDDGSIQRAGIALGGTENVDHFSDVLALLILQNGGSPAKPDQKGVDGNYLVGDALSFYTQFQKTDKVWDQTLPNSTYAFAMEKAAMIIAPSWRSFEIRQINPNVEFAVYPVPQLPGPAVTFASYWVEGVSNTATDKEMAWKFVKFLSQKETMQSLYTSISSSQRLFGEPYSRQDLASTLASDPYVGAYISQATTAKSWWLSSRTFDNGINDQNIKYYQDAVNAINAGSAYTDVLPTLSAGVTSVLKQYNVTVK